MNLWYVVFVSPSSFFNFISQKQIFVKPVKDVRSLEMTFPFPDQRPLYSVQVHKNPISMNILLMHISTAW